MTDDTLICDGSDLCSELRGAARTTFSSTYAGDPPSRVVGSTRHLRLIADYSPLTLGHLLLLPMDHVVSFGHIVETLINEIETLLASMHSHYIATFGTYSILEHGSSSSMTMTCISHAHWHIVPVSGSEVRSRMARDGLAAQRLGSSRDLAKFAHDDLTYFYCYDGASHAALGVGSALRRQYLRSIIGDIVGVPEPLWDYALVVRKEFLRETVALAQQWGLRAAGQGDAL